MVIEAGGGDIFSWKGDRGLLPEKLEERKKVGKYNGFEVSSWKI